MKAEGLAVLALTVAGCGSPLSPALDREFDLAFGREAVVADAGLRIAFVDVDDSRCPSDALILCVWAGEGIVHLRVEAGGDEGTVYQLHTLLEPRAVTVPGSGVEIELVSLAPYPATTDPIPEREYVATLVVRSAQ